ncbi:MAG: hypothetical protein V4438_01965 [Patescibacteria group bacterium]
MSQEWPEPVSPEQEKEQEKKENRGIFKQLAWRLGLVGSVAAAMVGSALKDEKDHRHEGKATVVEKIHKDGSMQGFVAGGKMGGMMHPEKWSIKVSVNGVESVVDVSKEEFDAVMKGQEVPVTVDDRDNNVKSVEENHPESEK